VGHALRQASFDKLRTNGKWMIPFVVRVSNHNGIDWFSISLGGAFRGQKWRSKA